MQIPASGDRVTVAGTYRCLACSRTVALSANGEFPRCLRSGDAVNWVLVIPEQAKTTGA